MNLILVGDRDSDGVRQIVVDAQGVAATRAAAVPSDIRRMSAPSAGYNVDGAGEDRDDGVVRWTFVIDDEQGHEAPEVDDDPSDNSTAPSWTSTPAD